MKPHAAVGVGHPFIWESAIPDTAVSHNKGDKMLKDDLPPVTTGSKLHVPLPSCKGS